MQRLRDHYFHSDWVKRSKARRKKTCRILRAPQLSRDEKIARLEQHRDELARWLRFQPLRFFWRLDSHAEARYVHEEIRRIAASIEQVKSSKARLARRQNDNSSHPHNQREI